ncbi:E3 ubiquitin-protein ligase ZNRF2 isoform X2 [Chrysemys picta bellii]|uniref:E3 ubiquitin-protein ligase ZNRF2 isoform X2 n=1 Tax=Chrysemys picta bellii TaxID=8478 RepID=UPI0032B230AC
MGAKQSGPAAANGRTRAYSGGDLPSGSGGANGAGGRSAGAGGRYTPLAPQAAPGSSAAGAAAAPPVAAPRSRSLVGAAASGTRAAQSAFSIPHSSGPYGSQDSVNSAAEEGGRGRPAGGGGHGGPRLVIGSLPAHLSPHLFGEDVLSKDAGECAICLEELQQGDTIARLPCLCIYHKGCIDEWFEVNRSCPEHPSD